MRVCLCEGVEEGGEGKREGGSHTRHGTHVKVRAQPEEAMSLLPLHGPGIKRRPSGHHSKADAFPPAGLSLAAHCLFHR